MAIVRFQPFGEMDLLHRQMNRLFEDFLPAVRDNESLANIPAAEISESDESYLLKLEIPGMEAKDLDVQITKDSVSVTGERKQETKTEEKGLTRTEFRYGKFQRVIPLPGQIQNNNVTAEYKDGILHLTLPKAEEEKNKVVKLNLG